MSGYAAKPGRGRLPAGRSEALRKYPRAGYDPTIRIGKTAPARSRPTRVGRSDAPLLENSLKVVKFLYVEDNDYLRESICSLIEQEHRQIEACADAETALAAMDVQDFDVLITDVSLPGMSGTDLARHWLAPDPTRWVLLCSGYDFRHGLETIGPNVRSLPKSFELEQLEALIGEIETAVRRAHASP